ncbi:MAG: DUF6273 domain-containing protein [Oscillospiraceae bacterium]|nr:DUF6273 domain-containing protein [Oscillospiraceae bacterium]
MKKAISLILGLVIILTMFTGFSSTVSAAGVSDLKIGDYVQIGKYQDAAILWRVIEIDNNGPLLLSDKILAMKDFNAQDPNAPDTGNWMKRTDGSNFWETSNLRAWLNSTADVVTWPRGLYPSRAETPGDVYYDPEPGFLHDSNFTASERSLIKSVKQRQVLTDFEKNLDTYGGSSAEIWINSISQLGRNEVHNDKSVWVYGGPLYEEQYAYDLTEKIFLLDVWQIDRLFDNDNLKTTKGDPYIFAEYAKASGLKGKEADDNFNGYGRWYSRTPCVRSQGGDNINGVYLLGVGDGPQWLYDMAKRDWHKAFWSGESPAGNNKRCGIRPAFYLETALANIKSGSGSKGNPYVISGITLSAAPSQNSFEMNGKPVSIPQAYNISGNNYLQLRAIAVLLNGTASQFNVGWDGQYAVIETGKAYDGAANTANMKQTTNVKPSNTSFKIDGVVVTFEKVYLIDGDTNYLQLREVAEKLSGTKSQFNVYWDDATAKAVIVPGAKYTGTK